MKRRKYALIKEWREEETGAGNHAGSSCIEEGEKYYVHSRFEKRSLMMTTIPDYFGSKETKMGEQSALWDKLDGEEEQELVSELEMSQKNAELPNTTEQE